MLGKLRYAPFFADKVLRPFLRHRLKLPPLDPHRLFPAFADEPITIRRMPQGAWGTPLADVAMLLKVIACAKPRRLLEIGSFRGFTTLLMAQHAPDDAHIVALDREPDHGEAYRDTPFAAKIEHRVCPMGPDAFRADPPGSFDLIFVDADHTYQGVRRDTELVLPLVAPHGHVLWHDYANWGYFDRTNGVPEYLNRLGQTRPVGYIPGSALAIHSPAWGGPDAETFRALFADRGALAWQTHEFRG